MIWADRVAIALYAAGTMLMVLVCATVNPGTFDWTAFKTVETLLVIPVGMVWILLRLIDFALGLPGLRAGRRHG